MPATNFSTVVVGVSTVNLDHDFYNLVPITLSKVDNSSL